MTINDFAVATNQTGNLKSELADGATHAIHSGVVLARIVSVEDQPVDRPNLNLRGLSRRFLREHTSPSDGQIGGAFRRVRFALAWRTEPLHRFYA